MHPVYKYISTVFFTNVDVGTYGVALTLVVEGHQKEPRLDVRVLSMQVIRKAFWFQLDTIKERQGRHHIN